MTKKIVCLVVVLSLVLSSLPVFASAADKTKFTRDTVITESNINDVLTSLGFDPTTSLGEKLDTVRIITVGELQDEIAKAKKMPKVIKVNSTVEKDSTTIAETSSTGNMSTMAITQTGTVSLTRSMSLGTTTNIRQTVLGDYSIVSGVKTWTGCRNPHVYVDAVLPWALSGYDLVYISWCDAGYTSTMITVNSRIGVNYWIMVLGFKFYPGSTQTVDTTMTWNTSYIPG